MFVIGEVGIATSEAVVDLTDRLWHNEGRSTAARNGSPVLTVGWRADVRVEAAGTELAQEVACSCGKPAIDNVIVLVFPIADITVLPVLISPTRGFWNQDAPMLGRDLFVECSRTFWA